MWNLVETVALVGLLLLGLVSCTAIAPSIAHNKDGSWTASAGQYALVDRLPGDDQQHETSTVTGLSVRDMSVGVAQRDVTRQPVATKPLFGVGFQRQQHVKTAVGDSLDSDYASGDAFAGEPRPETGEGGAP